jgi:chromosome segregation ATPase
VSNTQKLSLFLAVYNFWRRGGCDEIPSSHTPAKIGAALDEAVDLLEKYDELERENAALREDNLNAHQMACAAGVERDRLREELAALRHSEENLAATVRGLEFELEKAQKTAALLRGTVEALGDANDRLTIEITALRKQAKP